MWKPACNPCSKKLTIQQEKQKKMRATMKNEDKQEIKRVRQQYNGLGAKGIDKLKLEGGTGQLFKPWVARVTGRRW